MSAEFEPVFVVGCERSGTTLLATILGRHSSLAATPETHFFQAVSMSWRRGAPPTHDWLVRHFLRIPRCRELRLDSAQLIERFSTRAPTYPDLFQVAMELYAEQRQKPRVVEKTPVHLNHVPALLGWYPRAKVLHVVRDGRAVVTSLRAAPWTHDVIALHSVRWCRDLDRGLYHEARYPGRVMRVCFEDLVQLPEQALAALGRFLGVEPEPGMLTSERRADTVPDWERPWKAKALGAVDPERAQSWARETTPDERRVMEGFMRGRLARLGYPLTVEPERALRARLRFWATRAALTAIYNERVHPWARRGRWFAERLGMRFGHRTGFGARR